MNVGPVLLSHVCSPSWHAEMEIYESISISTTVPRPMNAHTNAYHVRLRPLLLLVNTTAEPVAPEKALGLLALMLHPWDVAADGVRKRPARHPPRAAARWGLQRACADSDNLKDDPVLAPRIQAGSGGVGLGGTAGRVVFQPLQKGTVEGYLDA